ncbi:phytoene desaturase family protein [Vitreimonas flagellata]|uniref:phytoene desaturase family protein n=1 Tax=Vitreimonas flagellata TaxID=2560861 RepID=UPI001074BDD5|nr:FAD-dependent oxidoreductase [Vitreimonas flagellata]
MRDSFDVVVLGAGLAGMAAACRLQANGFSTLVVEIHDKLGGCAGYYERDGFSFDIGATTLVDFDEGGVGGEFLKEIGLTDLALEHLPGYQAWLPDQTITLHRCPEHWRAERLRAFGDTPETRRFWRVMDELAAVFWPGAAKGLRLPIRDAGDVTRALTTLSPAHWRHARHLLTSLGQLVRSSGLAESKPLRGLLSMLCEDTLHARCIEDAPLINAALGTSIRGRIARPVGGFKGFWTALARRYRDLGGDLRLKTKVTKVEGVAPSLRVETLRGVFQARAIVNTIPAPNFAAMAPADARARMAPFLRRDAESYGAGIVVCLGVPQSEVVDHDHRHHQLLQDYEAPLGDGNNMFISISAAGDELCAPAGHRAVMVSTHTELSRWRDYDHAQAVAAKAEIGAQLLRYARRVYPRLGDNARVLEIGTPNAYARFARRPHGAVGGVRINMRNSNQFAMPCDLGGGVYVAGDYTWPGLGSVACLLSSRIAAEKIMAAA